MKQRGRVSIENALARDARKLVFPPPPGLGEEEAREWKVIMERMGGDWLPPETHFILEDLCCHIVFRRHLAARMAKHRNMKIKELQVLSRMMRSESQIVGSLATKLRLTPQSTVVPDKRKASVIVAPWEKEEMDDAA